MSPAPETAQHLAEIPALAEEAMRTWGSDPISDNGTRRHKVPDSLVLADLDRMVVLSGGNDHDGLGVLTTWIRHIETEMDEAGHPAHVWPAGPEITAACAWLASALPWCEGRGWDEELAKDVRRLHSALRVLCKRRGEYRPRCPKCTNRVVGIGPDKARTDDWTVAAYGFCLGCATTYPKGTALDALGQCQEFTLAEIAERVHVPLFTLHRWHRTRLLASTTAAPGRRRDRLFRLDDVLRVVEKMRGER